MKIKAELGQWSSVVGSGVLLIAEDGRMAGQVAILCHLDELRDKDVQTRLMQAICHQCCGRRCSMNEITTKQFFRSTIQTGPALTGPDLRAMLAAMRATRNDPATHEATARFIEDGLREQLREGGAV